ncbi:MAG TPA: hypothetical protein VIC27_14025, partial [Ktedonobacterales bacterium]
MIASRHNPTIKRIRALLNRRERDRVGLFLVEGIRIVAQAVCVHAPIQELVVAPDLLRSPFGQELVRRQAAAGVPCITVKAEMFKKL